MKKPAAGGLFHDFDVFLFVLAVVLLAGNRLAVAIGFTIQVAAFLFGDHAGRLRFFLVFLQLEPVRPAQRR